MPKPQPGEKREAYISRCIAFCVKNEGLSQNAAAGKCYGMWRQHKKKQAKSK
jgi:hypothetical protein